MSARVLVIPGGTAIGSAALAHAGLHKIVELYDERLADPACLAPHTIVVMRDPSLVPPATLRGAALDPQTALPEYAEEIERDSSFFDKVDLIIETSGSTSGIPKRVGLSIEAIVASIDATHEALDGPGAWILALPAHHIAGAMALLRSTRHNFPPRIVDTSAGFRPEALIPAVRGALSHGGAGYLAIVPAQLRKILAHSQAAQAVASLTGVLVGGQVIPQGLLDEARAAGIRVHTSYGMTETCGGVVYDGYPLPGVELRITDIEGRNFVPAGVEGRVAISSPTLMTRYLEGGEPWLEMEGRRWLLTHDWGRLSSHGRLSVLGRVDDVVISGGEKILPSSVEECLRSFEGVREACVVGIESPQWGSVVSALVVKDERVRMSDSSWAEEIYHSVREVLGKAYAPRVIVPVGELPLKDSGKVDRRRCVDIVSQAIGQGRAWIR